jgi:hypothetical protein
LFLELQGCKVIVYRFGPADQFHAPIAAQKQLLGPQLAVVVEAHGMAMGAGILDDQQIAILDGRQGRWTANLSLFSHREPTTSTAMVRVSADLPSTSMW